MKSISVKSLLLLLAVGTLAIVAAGFAWLWSTSNDGVIQQTTIGMASAVVLGGLLCVSFPLAIMTIRKITKPVEEIKEGVDRILDGDYSVCLACDGSDELAEMRLSIDSLFSRLKHNLGFAQGVLNGIDTPFVVVDTNEVLTYTNQSLLTILQQDGKPEEYFGQNVAYFFYGDATRPTVLRDSLQKHSVTKREVVLTGRKGGERNIYIHASPLFDLNGELMGALCIYQDLTDLRARENEIMAKNQAISTAAHQSEEISQDVARLANEIANQIQQTSHEVERQTDRATDTATAMEQMNAAVYDVARNASSAAEQATETRNKAQEGANVVSESMAAIDEVASQSEKLRENMSELGERAEGIGQVMNVITDIADQTNLLALNAAIEAARAGEAGRGFAVVADEVRKLAEKTMQATKEVGDAIRAIQEGARKNAESVDAASEAVTRSRELNIASAEALGHIVDLVNDTNDQVQAIATAAEEQSATSDHINQAVAEVREISEQAARELAIASEGIRDLAGKSDELRTIIHAIDS